ncbi:unnamed protein product, partial [Ixodes hexagonus]
QELAQRLATVLLALILVDSVSSAASSVTLPAPVSQAPNNQAATPQSELLGDETSYKQRRYSKPTSAEAETPLFPATFQLEGIYGRVRKGNPGRGSGAKVHYRHRGSTGGLYEGSPDDSTYGRIRYGHGGPYQDPQPEPQPVRAPSRYEDGVYAGEMYDPYSRGVSYDREHYTHKSPGARVSPIKSSIYSPATYVRSSYVPDLAPEGEGRREEGGYGGSSTRGAKPSANAYSGSGLGHYSYGNSAGRYPAAQPAYDNYRTPLSSDRPVHGAYSAFGDYGHGAVQDSSRELVPYYGPGGYYTRLDVGDYKPVGGYAYRNREHADPSGYENSLMDGTGGAYAGVPATETSYPRRYKPEPKTSWQPFSSPERSSDTAGPSVGGYLVGLDYVVRSPGSHGFGASRPSKASTGHYWR